MMASRFAEMQVACRDEFESSIGYHLTTLGSSRAWKAFECLQVMRSVSFSKLSKMFCGYFDAENSFLDNIN